MNSERTSPFRVVTVDDHAVVRQWIRSVLEASGEFQVVGEAGTVGQALQVVDETRPDVTIVDVRLPGGDGVQLVREILSRHEGARCLVLTSFPDAETAYHALMAGASGQIAKSASAEEVIGVVRTVATGGRLLRLDLLEATGADRSGRAQRRRTGPGLTRDEERVLELIAHGLTNRQIAAELDVPEKIVRNDVWRILGKLRAERWTDVASVLVEGSRRGRERRSRTDASSTAVGVRPRSGGRG